MPESSLLQKLVLLVSLVFFFLMGGYAIYSFYQDMTGERAPLSSLPQIGTADEALFRLDGLPGAISVEGEIDVRGALHEIVLLGSVPGQRAYGVPGLSLDDLNGRPHSYILRLIDQSTGAIGDITVSVDLRNKRFNASLSGFPAGGKGALSLGGRTVHDQTPLDWNGRIVFDETLQNDDLIQLYIAPDAYQTYSFYAGSMLPYYLQDFGAEEEKLGGLPPFPLSDETTTADSNKLAETLLDTPGSHLGWWVNADQTLLLVRTIAGDCMVGCETKIFKKQGQDNDWREVFSAPLNDLWINPQNAGKPDSVLYAGLTSRTDRWIWRNDRYELLDTVEGGK